MSTDPADASASSGVMVAFLPTVCDWSKVELPHMTLVYAGTTDDVSVTDFNNLAKDAASLALLASPFYLASRGVQSYGPDNDKVNALILQPTPDLWAMRRYLEKWNKSEFPFNPHVTIGPYTSFVAEGTPRTVGFDRLCVGYGSEYLTFNLRRGNGMSY